MKPYISLILALLLGFGSVQAQRDKFTVKVDGLGCPFCAYGLEKKFKEVEGISKIAIEIEGGVLTYEVPAENAMTLAQAEERVTAAGYTPRHVAVMRADGRNEQTAEAVVADATGAAQKTFKVSGSCDMCKARIEKAALGVNGVKSAAWDAERQMLTVALEPSTPLSDVQAAVAKSGHDTASARANGKTYANLPACCQYR